MIRCGQCLAFFTLILLASCRNKRIADEIDPKPNEFHQGFINAAISNHSKYPKGDLITDKETAVDIAEPILFKTFGKDKILNERPYHCHLIDGYWSIKGSLPGGMDGGVFEIILSAKDAQIIQLTHSK